MSRSSTKKFLLGTAILLAIGGGVALVQISPWGDAIAQTAGGEMPAMPVPYLAIEQKPTQIWKSFSGRLTAVDSAEIRPQVSGIIEKIHFKDGQIVEKGDVLYTIDQRPYQAAVAQAKAEAFSAQNEIEYARKEMARAEELLKTGAVSKQGYDNTVNSLKVNEGNLGAANARVKAAQVDLDRTSIEAPISGRISRPEITEGNLVSASNAPLLTTIVSDSNIYADFDVDEQTYVGFIRTKSGESIESEQGVPVRMYLNNDAKPYQGTIKSFDNKISATTGTIRARAMFANHDNALLPGMFARVEIGSSDHEDLITVPENAVLTDQSRKFVYVVEGGAATYREVKLGDNVGHDRIVLSGLKVGDKVIIDNLMKIRPGAKVNAMTPQELDAMKKQMAAGQGGGAPATPEAAPAEADVKKAEDKPADAVTVPTSDAEEAQPIPFDEPADEDASQDETPAQDNTAGSTPVQE